MAQDDSRAAYIKELAEYLHGRFSKQKKAIENTRKLRALLHDVVIPTAYEKTTQKVRTPILADMVSRITATLTVNYPTWSAAPIGMGDTAADRATLKEKWMSAAHQRMEKENNRRVFRQGMSAAIADGMGVWQYLYKPNAWHGFPERSRDAQGEYAEEATAYTRRGEEFAKRAPFPFAWLDVDPLNYYYYEGDDNSTEVLLIKKMPLKPTLKRLHVYRQGGKWRDGKLGKALPPTDTNDIGNEVEVYEHWDANTTTYMIDNEIVKTVRHGWGRVPFCHFAGLSSHENTPERTFLPVCFAFEHLIPLLDQLLTMKQNWLHLASFPQPILKLRQIGEQMAEMMPPEDRGQSFEKKYELGKLLVLEPDEDFVFATPPAVGVDLNQIIDLTMRMIDMAGIGNVMRGQGMGSDQSGYLANQMMTAARLAYDPITDNAKFALERGAQFLLWCIDRIVVRSVYVWGERPKGKGSDWLGLSDKEIDGFHDMECKLEPLLPSNFIMEGRFGLEQWQAGAIPLKFHQEQYLHVSSPEELEKQKLIEDFKNSPQVKAILMEQIARKNQMMGLLPPPPPPPPPQLVGPDGVTPIGMLGNTGLPVTPGQGMPLDQGAVRPGQVPALPGAGVPGPAVNPGGNFGRQVVVNAGGI